MKNKILNIVVLTAGIDEEYQQNIIRGINEYAVEKNINILDISQTILNGCFTMMMVVEFTDENSDLSIVKESLDELAKKTALDIRIQHEDIFNAMHRL